MDCAYSLIVFDWEGTLSDPFGHIIHILKEYAQHQDLDFPSISLVRKYLTLGLDRALKKIFTALSPYHYENLMAHIQEYLHTHPQSYELFEGAESLIQALTACDIDLAIATNKSAASLQRALQATHLAPFFKITRAAGQVPPKPCPQMLEEILNIFDKDAAQALMIGDSIADIEMARALNVTAIGVDFYEQHETSLLDAGAIRVFRDYTELHRFLISNIERTYES